MSEKGWYDHGDDMGKAYATCQRLQQRVEELQAQLTAEKEKNRWIPVGKRLPKKTGEYFVLPRIKHCPSLWFQDGGWFWYDHTDDCISDTIRHRPIPVITHWRLITLPEKEKE